MINFLATFVETCLQILDLLNSFLNNNAPFLLIKFQDDFFEPAQLLAYYGP